MSDVCISPGALVVITAMVSSLFGLVVWLTKDSIREARAERDRMAEGWEMTIGLGEKVIRQERRRP